MSILPTSTDLGQLEIIEIYEFIDKPALFACRNNSNQIFLSVLTDEDEKSTTWFYVSVSPRRFDLIRSGGFDLHDAFSLSEDGFIRIVVISKTLNESSVKLIQLDQLSDNDLPLAGEYLNIPTSTVFELDEIKNKATQARREYLRLKFEFFNLLRTEAPVNLLGDILVKLQELVNAIGQAMLGTSTERGSIPQELINKMELSVVGMGPGSFQIELASSGFVDLFNESDLGNTLDEFILLLNLSEHPDELKDQLIHLKLRVASKYLGFLEAINDRIVNTRIEWASPKGNKGEAELSSVTVKSAIATIEQAQIQPVEELLVQGRLIGANIDKKTYEIWVVKGKDRQSFSGKVSDEAMQSLENATLSLTYYATIRKVTHLKPITGEIEEKYELTKLLRE